MLSRIAESLFWLGRYSERAEDTARILDVHFHLLLEDRWVDESSACGALLEVMGANDRAAAGCDSSAVTRVLAFDEAYEGSIVGSIRAAWENARGAREAVSSEMWECLNATHEALQLHVDIAEDQTPHHFFRWVKERAAMLSGLADSTMSRDSGWRFLVLGRSLERVDMTARLLSARYGESWGQAGWVTTLRCCSAYEAYLRTYQRAVDASLAAEFLLLDRLFPRSLFHALHTAEECLAVLDPGFDRAGIDDAARRALGKARNELEFRSVDDLLADLPGHLFRLQQHCFEASTAVADRYFRATRPMEWTL
ncbi:MAG TPA: alpha-E domain-containing protein [Acidimicrobiales bacterium]|nr:alpha-E domain-containing protein [Acidimicrobiales bacterium]